MNYKTNSVKRTLLLTLIHVSICGCLVSAQNDSDQSDIINLEPYAVTANRMEMDLGKVGASLTVLSRIDIEKYESELATEAIRHIPGIYVRNSGGLGNAAGFTVRGLPIAPLVLIDGIEVNNPNNGGVFNFGFLPSLAIERIEVLRGAQSSLYGANAVSGVISVSTKQAVEDGNSVAFGGSYGAHNSLSGFVTASGKMDWMNYSVVVNAYDTDGYSSQPETFGEEWADDDGYKLNAIHSRFGFKFNEKMGASVVVHYHESESEYDPGLPSPWSVVIMDNYSTQEQLLFKAQLDFEASDLWTMSASYSYTEADDFSQNGWGWSTGEAEMNKIDWLNQFKPFDNYRALVGMEIEDAADGIGNYSFQTSSIFMEHVYDVNEALTATAGARFDDNDAYGQETTWRTSFAYHLGDTGVKLHGTYGTGFDAPEISQLFGAWGNPALVAEKGHSYDLGVEWASKEGMLAMGVNYFSMIVEDRVEFLRSTFSYANVDWESTGIEAFVDYNITQDTHVHVSYSYADARREKAVDNLILHSPEGMLRLMLDQEFLDDKLQLRVTAQQVGERESWEGPTDGFFTMNLSASYQINAQLKVWLRAENIFDEEYQEVLNYNGAPQAFSVGFSYEM